MAASLENSPSPIKARTTMLALDSPLSNRSSEKRFWNTLQSRVDSLLEARQHEPVRVSTKRLKDDSMLLLRGFDSVSHTLNLLSNNIDNALQGARDLCGSPTLKDIFHSKLKSSEEGEKDEESKEKDEECQRGLKRKYDADDCAEDQTDDDAQKNCEEERENKTFMRAKNIAVSMARKSASLARELKSLKSDLCFMQERSSLLEEENRRLRDGFTKGMRPDEDDLVRLQLEALLAEKSRLANENANLVRENQCLHQLVEYHQITSQDLSASYEQVIQGMCLDFSSPTPSAEGEGEGEGESPKTPRTDFNGIFTTLDELDHQEH